MNDFKIPFAYNKDNVIIDIKTAKKKTDYKCMCGATVRVRGGDKIRNHFYHSTGRECSLESAIHLAYKDVFKRCKRIELPYKINGSKTLIFDRVELEKKVSDFVPDAIGYIENEMYLIEFAKTSYIGERKEKKIKKANLFCLEVYINTSVNDLEQIREHLVNSTYCKHVVHVPMYKEMKELRNKFKEAYHKLEKEKRQESLKFLESETKVKELRKENSKLQKQLFDESIRNSMYVAQKGSSGLIGQKINIPFLTVCRNGAKLYKANKKDFSVSVFINDEYLTLSFDKKEEYPSRPKRTNKTNSIEPKEDKTSESLFESTGVVFEKSINNKHFKTCDNCRKSFRLSFIDDKGICTSCNEGFKNVKTIKPPKNPIDKKYY